MSVSAWWPADQVAAIEHAVESAAGGRPALLVVEGAPGTGKSTLLGEAEERARNAGFRTIGVSSRRERAAQPFSLLYDLGIRATQVEPAADPFQAAQAVRELLDAQAKDDHPVFVAVDDLQWADRESVEAVTWLLRRSDGERLLLALAARPPSPGRAEMWRRLKDGAGPRLDVTSLHLEGLSRELTGRLMMAEAPGTDAELIDRLWRHTGGNPLYLRTLLREYDVCELREMVELPAPDEVTRSVTARLEGLDPDAVILARTVAVLGDDWSPLPRAVEVAGLTRAGDAVGLLEREDLLRVLGTGAQARVRLVHSVVRAAVYSDIPSAQRGVLHRRAAATATSGLQRLWHRFAAADGYDAELAGGLADAARQYHEESAHRDSARLLGWSADVTNDPGAREARRLDALFELALARDVDEVAFRLGDHDGATDVPRRALAVALELIIRWQSVRARDVLDDVPDQAMRDADAATRYRLLTLRAWTGAVTGRPSSYILADLDEAERTGRPDGALTAYAVVARRQAEQGTSPEQPGPGPLSTPPEPHQHLTGAQLYELGWTGAKLSVIGDQGGAIRCLLRFTESLRSGPRDPSDGGYRALLGYAQWMKGDWEAARVTIRLALESRFGSVHPMVAAVAPLVRLATGDLAGASAASAESRAGLVLAPWPAAVQVALVTAVVVRHLEGDADARGRLLGELTGALGPDTVLHPSGGMSLLTALHLGLAYVWAGRPDEAQRIALEGERRRSSLPWSAGALAWLHGLAALSRNDPAGAQQYLRAAVPGLAALPLHRAHAAADLVLASELIGDAASAADARDIGLATYTRLGLHDHAGRLSASPPGKAADHPLAPLSDRERDVVALLARGLSYTQIARELYVSRSTVAFHLGNIYAKTNTSSRHELVDLLHATAQG